MKEVLGTFADTVAFGRARVITGCRDSGLQLCSFLRLRPEGKDHTHPETREDPL